MSNSALEGLKIADFSWVIAGPWLTSVLAAFGATVVRVESVDQPGILRVGLPYKDGIPGVNRSGYYAFLNTNKLSLALDIKNPKGLELAKKLVAWSDVVVENFTPGVMEEFGLGYEDLKMIKPDIIMVRLSGYGQNGPYTKASATGIQLAALSGLVNLTGWPDRGALPPYGAYPDFIAPRLGAVATIAALMYRNRVGKGACIDISQLEASVYFLGPALLNYFLYDQESTRRGNHCPYMVPHGVYRCRGEDRWVAIEVFDDVEWRSLCEVAGNPDWAFDPRFSTAVSRKEHEDELDQLIEAWTINLAAEEVMACLQASGIACGVVKNAQDVYEEHATNERLKALFWTQRHDEMGETVHLGQVPKLSKTPAEQRFSSPCLGQHTEFVCREILKITDEEFVESLKAGAFGGL